jgi:hypothetical protein
LTPARYQTARCRRLFPARSRRGCPAGRAEWCRGCEFSEKTDSWWKLASWQLGKKPESRWQRAEAREQRAEIRRQPPTPSLRRAEEGGVIRYRLSGKTVGQARRLPIHRMASGSACPTNLLSNQTSEVGSRKSFAHATKSEIRGQRAGGDAARLQDHGTTRQQDNGPGRG